jgi:hypothetical protein
MPAIGTGRLDHVPGPQVFEAEGVARRRRVHHGYVF